MSLVNAKFDRSNSWAASTIVFYMFEIYCESVILAFNLKAVCILMILYTRKSQDTKSSFVNFN